MAKFDLPDEGVSFMDYENKFYDEGGTKPPLSHDALQTCQDLAREHDTQMDVLKQQRERARHE